MKKLCLTLAACVLLMCQANAAKAALITFDDYGNGTWTGSGPISYDYKGFEWEGGLPVPGIYYGPSSPGVLSGNYAMYGYGTLADPQYIYKANENENFDLISAYFTSYSSTLEEITVFGLDNDAPKYLVKFKASSTIPYFQQFNWTGIDKIQIYSNNGYTMDNMLVNSAPVPEPTSMTLGLLSLLGLTGIRRKRK